MDGIAFLNPIYMNLQKTTKVIAFDADDTLWDNEPFFQNVEAEMCKIMAPYGSAEEVSKHLFAIEMDNMPDYGYGAVAFTMSLIENAIKFSKGAIPANDIGRIIELGRTLVRLKATPLKGVSETLQALKKSQKYKMVVFTKGELLTQENKLKRSGLLPYFDETIIVSDKKEPQYNDLCTKMGIESSALVMVGNSLRSDILPALNIGAYGIFIPYEVMWQHEVIDHFEHERMIQIERFEELKGVFGVESL